MSTRKYYKWRGLDKYHVIAFLIVEGDECHNVLNCDGNLTAYKRFFSPNDDPTNWLPSSRCAMRKYFQGLGIDYDRSL